MPPLALARDPVSGNKQMRMGKLKLKYLKRKFVKSDSDWKDGDWYCDFHDVEKNEIESIRETKLLKTASLQAGQVYLIDFGGMHYPQSIEWSDGKAFIRNNNSIILVDADGNETNTSADSIRMQLYKLSLKSKSKK